MGRPNVGKSSLLNALVGAKLSIVSPKAQTTWQKVTGIHTSDRAQIIFLDTPGLLEGGDLLHRSMLGAALGAVHEADLLLLVLDASADLSAPERHALRRAAEEVRGARLAAINKIDLVDDARIERTSRWAREELEASPHRVSALDGKGVEALRAGIEEALPPGPFLYPADELATEPVRHFVAELIRETVFDRFRQEIPYSVFCQIEEFRESQDPIYIGATLHVERQSQKGILIGEGGKAIRGLGAESRKKIEDFLGRSVYLDLWVKTLPKWRRRKRDLKRLGFQVPEDDGSRTG